MNSFDKLKTELFFSAHVDENGNNVFGGEKVFLEEACSRTSNSLTMELNYF